MGAVIIKKQFFKMLVIYCLIKSFKAPLKIKDSIIKENAFLILFLFGKYNLT
jgi:hypothetical protein